MAAAVGNPVLQSHWYHVEYESLHLICGKCGVYGHVTRFCDKKDCIPLAHEQSQGMKPGSIPIIIQDSELKNIAGHGSDPIIIQDSELKNIPGPSLCSNTNKDALHGEWLVVSRTKKTSQVKGKGKAQGKQPRKKRNRSDISGSSSHGFKTMSSNSGIPILKQSQVMGKTKTKSNVPNMSPIQTTTVLKPSLVLGKTELVTNAINKNPAQSASGSKTSTSMVDLEAKKHLPEEEEESDESSDEEMDDELDSSGDGSDDDSDAAMQEDPVSNLLITSPG
ncbi:hypothetical protein SESBI_09172 [Sesbania bispinosa]|nr:hypothetical protein SESBI_09172 [Sesbania bispinosa]